MTPAHPKVSVCVITYNQERYIRECLDSLVAQQTDFAFEIIVADDCSTDGTRAIVDTYVERYPNLVRTNHQPSNTGGSRNYLEVHAAARGDYVAHVDGDDYALPGKLQAQADVLDRDADCVAVWHRMDLFDDEGTLASGRTADLSSFPDGRVMFRDAASLGYVGAHSSLMYRRRDRTPVDPGRKILDFHLTLDLLAKGHGVLLDEVLGRYRVASAGSLQGSSDRPNRQLAIAHAREFLLQRPDARRDFAIWAASNALFDLRRRKSTAWDFIKLFRECRARLSVFDVIRNVKRMKNTQVRWKPTRQAGSR